MSSRRPRAPRARAALRLCEGDAGCRQGGDRKTGDQRRLQGRRGMSLWTSVRRAPVRPARLVNRKCHRSATLLRAGRAGLALARSTRMRIAGVVGVTRSAGGCGLVMAPRIEAEARAQPSSRRRSSSCWRLPCGRRRAPADDRVHRLQPGGCLSGDIGRNRRAPFSTGARSAAAAKARWVVAPCAQLGLQGLRRRIVRPTARRGKPGPGLRAARREAVRRRDVGQRVELSLISVGSASR